jgi:hypothetical protein
MMVTNLISVGQFPALSALWLTTQELQQLSRQGGIRQERRGEKTIWKLRYRCDGRQHVKYIPIQQLDVVRAELSALQSLTRLRRALKQCTQRAKLYLKKTKAEVEALTENSDYYFHGFEIRRSRGHRPTAVNSFQ